MSDEEEMVSVYLADDYDGGTWFLTDWGGPKDYLIPRSQLERWEAAETAWKAAQIEIRRVMHEQADRIRELNAKRPKSKISQWVQDIYGPLLQSSLEQGAMNTLHRKEPE